jgi:SAM-dependent methyltransferase
MELDVYKRVYNLYTQGHWFFKGRNRIIQNIVNKIYKSSSKDPIILDIGCSTGIITKDLLSKGFNIFGIDNEDKALEFCTNVGLNGRVIKADIYNLPFLAKSFDCVTAFDVMEHLDDLVALRQIKRVLRPNGKVLLICPAYHWLWSKKDIVYHHKRRYCKSDLNVILENSGFIVERCSYFNFFLFPVFIIAVLSDKYLAALNSKFDFLKPVPFFINVILTKLMFLEAFLVDRYGLPFGSSLICLARSIDHA